MGVADYQRRKAREVFNITSTRGSGKKRSASLSSLSSSSSSLGIFSSNKRRRFAYGSAGTTGGAALQSRGRLSALSSAPSRLLPSSTGGGSGRRRQSSLGLQSLSFGQQARTIQKQQHHRLRRLMMGSTQTSMTRTGGFDDRNDDIVESSADNGDSDGAFLKLCPKTVSAVKNCVIRAIDGGEHNMTSIAREIESDVDCIDAYADQFLEQSTESDVGGIGTGGAIFGRSLMNKFGFGKKKRQEEHLMARRYEWTNTFRYLRNAPDIRDAKITTWDDAQSILKRVVTFPTSDRLEDGDHNDAGVMIDKVDDHGETSQSLKKNHMKNFEATLARLSIGADFTSANNKWRKVAEVANSISLQNVDDEKLKEYASMRKMDLEYNARLDTQDKKDKAYRESSVVKEIEERQKAKEAAKRASSLMRPLSDEELDLVERAVNGYSLGHNAIVAQDGSDSVQQSSMHTLQPGQWVGDEVIHYFYHMLSKRDKEMCDNDPSRRPSHFFKSFFMTKLLNEGHASKDGQYEYNNVKRWSKKVPGKDLFGLNKIFFPINMGNAHWIAACIFMEKKRIEIFDSMGGSGRVYLDALFQYLKDEHMSKNGSPLPHQDQWELVPTQRDTPRQRNGYDCGVFTCMFADFVSKDCPLVFNQDHINQCRHRIALSILNGKAIM